MKKMLTLIAVLTLVSTNAYGMSRLFSLLPDWLKSERQVFNEAYDKAAQKSSQTDVSTEGARGLLAEMQFNQCIVISGNTKKQCLKVVAELEGLRDAHALERGATRRDNYYAAYNARAEALYKVFPQARQ